jgi:hypothetical protein
VTTLIFFEDAGASLFGRRGKDGGQDARSSDGTLVYQAKFHQDASAAKAIADAKGEAAKIEKYKESGHSRELQWRGVTHWRLVTNAAFNPTDLQRWKNEVVPLFERLDIVADYWEEANLDALLTEHSEVERAYFGNEVRAFLSLPEVRDMLPSREPFLERSALGRFVGREDEERKIRSFLDSNHLFLLVHGAGGIGKTRAAVEVGQRIAKDGIWQVLWANVASMEMGGASWFVGIIPERQTLLIVDEPDSEQILRALAEELGNRGGRASRWKVVITVRSPKDPVLKFLAGPRIKSRVDQLVIRELPPLEAESMCSDLMESGPLVKGSAEWKKTAAKELASRFSGHPVWLTLAVHVLEVTNDLTRVQPFTPRLSHKPGPS